MEDIEKLLGKFKANAPATKRAIEESSKALGVTLPADYVEFLLMQRRSGGSWGELSAAVASGKALGGKQRL